MDARSSRLSTEAKNHRNSRSSEQEKKVRPPPKVEEEDTLDDESSPDELVPNKSPARPGSKKEPRLYIFPLELPTLTECVYNMENLEEDDDDDDDESVPTSPNIASNTLLNEFRFLSTITDVDVIPSSIKRKCLVSVVNKGEHTIRLIMSFPENYPEGDPPTFHFDENTTLDKTLQGKLITELDEAASPLIANHKVCVEKCIYKLKKSIDELESKNALDLDARYQSAYLEMTLSTSYNKNIPYPRTCGATFCNDRLITFQRKEHPPHLTPRSLSEGHPTPHSTRTRPSYFSSQISRSPKDSMLASYLKRPTRNKPLIKKEKSGPIFIYDVAALLPVNKSIALDYKMDPTAKTCRHNAEVATRHGRRDLHQLWNLLEEFMDTRLTAADVNSAKPGVTVPWASLPFGRSMIESIISHYATIGDFQTLAMIVCMFPFSCELPPRVPDRLPVYSLQRSSSNMKIGLLGTSPAASSMIGRSPPDKSHLTIDAESLSNGWTNASIASRRRADSHNSSLQDMRNSYNDLEMDQQKLGASTQMLDPKQAHVYELYKHMYAEQLYRWCLLDERSLLLNTVSLEGEGESPPIALTCGSCDTKYSKSWCQECSDNCLPALQCAMCRSGVKGPASLCLRCGHGGHVQHIRLWFESEEECPTGCGCHCLAFNGIEH